LSATIGVLAGSRVLSAGMGALFLSGVASLAQLVIDYELCQTLEHLARGFIVDQAHIGLEMIKRVGIGGNFLAEEHTLHYMRETLFFPELGDRRMVADWQQDRKGMLERARDKVRQVLKRGDHQEYLAPEQVRELERIARRTVDIVTTKRKFCATRRLIA
jgi:trimethylamine--corrinoid protein Co-methyltransferase